MNGDDGLPRHWREAFSPFHLFQRGETRLERAEAMAIVARVEQATMAREDVPLDPPSAKETDVSPELPAAKSPHQMLPLSV
jgi:hypothetical protein